MNQQRRIFRGRGGPTDRRLPKHNARRRRRLPPGAKPPTAATTLDEATAAAVTTKECGNNMEATRNAVNVLSESAAYNEDIDSSSNNNTSSPSMQKDDQELSSPVDNNKTTTMTVFQNEINHLLQRIRNNKNAMQTSKLAVNKPDTYQTNVLFAVQNCATEWKSILRYYLYNPVTKEEEEEEETSSEMISICQTTGLALFELVQQALQCGPLAGAKPGYFARCGSDTALVVLQFLQELLPEKEDTLDSSNKSTHHMLFWSDKQVATMEKWKQNAAKAVEKQKTASKSVQKKQQQASSHGNKKKGEKKK